MSSDDDYQYSDQEDFVDDYGNEEDSDYDMAAGKGPTTKVFEIPLSWLVVVDVFVG